MHNQVEPFLIYRNWETCVTSHDLRAVLPRRLTVDRGWRRNDYRNGGATLFREVEALSWQDALPAEAVALADAPIATLPQTRAENVATMAQCFEDVIRLTWDYDKTHLQFHSGGYDSRIISAAIRNVMGTRADVLFVCLGHEGDVFEQVMRAEGWSRRHYVTIPDVAWLVRAVTNMYDAGRWLNGVTLQALDFNYLLVEHLQELGLLPANDNDIQLFGGRNEALMGATMPGKNDMRAFYHEAYASHLAVSRYKVGDVVFPFTAYDTIRAALASSYRVNWSSLELQRIAGWRRDIGTQLCPELDGIPHVAMAWPSLPAGEVGRMRRAYERSWYGVHCWPKAVEGVSADPHRRGPWWGAFTAAALCEALIGEGYELTAS